MQGRYNIHTLRKLAEKSELVSFDVFDTALLRMLKKPRDVFLLLEKRLSEEAGKSVDFASARICAEENARREIIAPGREDVTLDEIYERLRLPGFGAEKHDEIKNLEIEAEREVCRANPEILEFFNELVAAGKPVVFASDMYLPRRIIAKLLTEAGYDAFREIYVSCECGASKAGGGLFKFICAAEGVRPADVLHVGDSRYSDVERARAAGLKAHHYIRPRRVVKNKIDAGEALYHPDLRGEALPSSLYESLLDNATSSGGFWYRLGFERLGVLLLGFNAWLSDRLRRGGVERVYFCSRDGYILKKVYDLFHDEEKGLPQSRYLYVSRRSLFIPALYDIDALNLDSFIGGDYSCRATDVFKRLGLNEKDFAERLEANGFGSFDERLEDSSAAARLLNLIKSRPEIIMKQAASERVAVRSYFQQEALDRPGKMALVDIGWRGSIQNAAGRILENEFSRRFEKGYYLATLPQARDYVGPKQAEAFLVNYGVPADLFALLQAGLVVLELLHIASHGSVLRYEDAEGETRAIQDDNISPQEIEIIEELHRGVFDFLEAWKSLPQNLRRHAFPDAKLSLSPIARTICFPGHEELRLIGSCRHVSTAGSAGHSQALLDFSQVQNASFNIRNAVRAYRKAYWKGGFLASLAPLNRSAIKALLALRNNFSK